MMRACPECGREASRATCLRNAFARSRPGDIAVCGECGAVLIFTEAGTMRSICDDELEHLGPAVRGEAMLTSRLVRRFRAALKTISHRRH
jgi:hypothetical protein